MCHEILHGLLNNVGGSPNLYGEVRIITALFKLANFWLKKSIILMENFGGKFNKNICYKHSLSNEKNSAKIVRSLKLIDEVMMMQRLNKSSIFLILQGTKNSFL